MAADKGEVEHARRAMSDLALDHVEEDKGAVVDLKPRVYNGFYQKMHAIVTYFPATKIWVMLARWPPYSGGFAVRVNSGPAFFLNQPEVLYALQMQARPTYHQGPDKRQAFTPGRLWLAWEDEASEGHRMPWYAGDAGWESHKQLLIDRTTDKITVTDPLLNPDFKASVDLTHEYVEVDLPPTRIGVVRINENGEEIERSE